MPDWFHNTPYELLGLKRNANKKQITAAYNATRRTKQDNKQQRQLSDARDKLERPAKRATVDVFLPNIDPIVDEMQLTEQLAEPNAAPIDWQSFIDREAIFVSDIKRLLAIVVQMSFVEPAAPDAEIHESTHYLGLDEFAKELGL